MRACQKAKKRRARPHGWRELATARPEWDHKRHEILMSKPAKRLKFEEAMQRLDAIVEAMESGQIGVEESIAKYEEAMSLAAHCRQILDQAEQRIQKIQLDASGKPQIIPFEPPPFPADQESAAEPGGDEQPLS
jgi:exodeoxyribonuclease VII small subunit